MASNDVPTMNLFDDGEGMVPLPGNNRPSTAFKQPEKNMSIHKDTMDSTPINDIMMDQNMMAEDPRAQHQMAPQQSQSMYAAPPSPSKTVHEAPESKNPFNLTDDQLVSLLVAVATAIAVSKPIQDRLATSIPKFLNEQGGRSMVGLATTGVIAAVIFFISKTYIIKA
jgi:hypothetical protein|tara:strand:- start:6584 stop:7087 length:504 start_codon:yes stop_codon:yes gene_type:complete